MNPMTISMPSTDEEVKARIEELTEGKVKDFPISHGLGWPDIRASVQYAYYKIYRVKGLPVLEAFEKVLSAVVEAHAG